MGNNYKNTELDDQELWDLLKENPEEEKKEERKTPEKKTAETEKTPVVTERRKKALVLYLIGLFGIAFIVVLVSLLMNGKSKTPNPVDDTQLKALQAQVQTLETEKKTLEETNKALTTEIQGLTEQIEVLEEKNDEAEAKIYELDCLLIELSNASEYLESGSVDANAQVEMLLQKISTYETLIKAQSKFIQVDDEALEAALNALDSQLHHLSDEALNAYYMILEYMEQPYRGN